MHDPRVSEYLREAKQYADELQAKLQQVTNRRAEIEKRKKASWCCGCCVPR